VLNKFKDCGKQLQKELKSSSIEKSSKFEKTLSSKFIMKTSSSRKEIKRNKSNNYLQNPHQDEILQTSSFLLKNKIGNAKNLIQ